MNVKNRRILLCSLVFNGAMSLNKRPLYRAVTRSSTTYIQGAHMGSQSYESKFEAATISSQETACQGEPKRDETHSSNLTAKTKFVYVRHSMVVTTAPLASMSIKRRCGRQSFNHVWNSSARTILWEARCILRRRQAVR